MDLHRRRLPHIAAVGRPIFVTWRLYGSLPANRGFSAGLPSGRAFVAMDRLLDCGTTGPLFLRMPPIAKVVVDAIRCRDRDVYELHTYVVMPNHVHLLMTPQLPLSTIMHSLKRYTARECNRVLGLTGHFWQDESFDRLVRDRAEFDRIVQYIENNPVTAGLARTPQEFLWSSAARAD